MSDWKESAIKRRDERHTKVSDEPNQSLKISKKKKDTKNWCRGKSGVEHKLECQKYNDVKRTGSEGFRQATNRWRILVCSVCGKELETYTGRNKNKPEWVDK